MLVGTACKEACLGKIWNLLTALGRHFLRPCWSREHRKMGRSPRTCVCGGTVWLWGGDSGPWFTYTASTGAGVWLVLTPRSHWGLSKKC